MAKQKQSPKTTARHRLALLARVLLAVLVLLVAGYVLHGHWPTVLASLRAARQAQASWLAVGVCLMVLTFILAAAIYGTLALHSLRLKDTVLIEVAAACVNRLLPSGLGGLGLHGLYLYRRRHTPAEATAVVSVNNLLGMFAHLLLLALALGFRPELLKAFLGHRLPGLSVWLLGGVVLIAVAGLLAPVVRRQVALFAVHVLESLRRLRAAALLRAFVLAMLLTISYTLLLWASARSIGVSIGVLKTFIVFSLGMLTSTVTPTPGGLVGAEAGLYAGLVAYDVAAVPAGATVLLYRLASYWLPLLGGAVALPLAKRRKLL